MIAIQCLHVECLPHMPLCALQLKQEQSVLKAVAAGDSQDFSLALDIMQAVVFSFLWGHLPPSRVGCILSMHTPDFQGPCTNPDCKNPIQCLGNRIFYHDNQLYLHLPHHKVEATWGHRAPQPFPLPASMLPFLQQYLGWAREYLLQEMQLPEGNSHLLFFHPWNRVAFTTNSFNPWFKKMLVSLGASQSMNLNPHKLRYIFVGERRSGQAVAGPCEPAAAMMMGHSHKQWDLYEGRYWDRTVTQCLKDMVTWRHALVAQVKVQAPNPPLATGRGGHVSDENDDIDIRESD